MSHQHIKKKFITATSRKRENGWTLTTSARIPFLAIKCIRKREYGQNMKKKSKLSLGFRSRQPPYQRGIYYMIMTWCRQPPYYFVPIESGEGTGWWPFTFSSGNTCPRASQNILQTWDSYWLAQAENKGSPKVKLISPQRCIALIVRQGAFSCCSN